MTIVLIVGAVLGGWMVVALVLALLLGRTIGLADSNHRRTMATRHRPVSRAAARTVTTSRPVLVGVNPV